MNPILKKKLTITLLVVAATAGVLLAEPFQERNQSLRPMYQPGEIIVRFKDNVPEDRRENTVQAMGMRVMKSYRRARFSRVELAANQSVAEALEEIQRDPDVEFAEPNYIHYASAAPNDPQYSQLWAARNTGQAITDPMDLDGRYTVYGGTAGKDMRLEQAWAHQTDCSSVVVAVLDSGINYDHEDLSANMWDGSGGCVDDSNATIPGGCPKHGYDFADDDDDPMDLNGHGTHVAGTIGARGDNGLGVAGVCWQANIMAVRVLGADGGGTTTDIVDGLEFAYNNGAKVVNMSLGSPNYSSLLNSAIAQAAARDVLIVAAAGNSGADLGSNNSYPCEYNQPNILCVGALDQNFNLASFSNYGSVSVDVAAPGTNILSTMAGELISTSDDFSNGWSGLGGGSWRAYNGGATSYCLSRALINPTDYCSNASPAYDAGVDQAAKQYSGLANGSEAVTLHIASSGSVVYLDPGDTFKMFVDTDTDPFSGGTQFVNVSSSTLLAATFDLSATCAGSTTCSLGFELDGGSSGFGYGAAVQGGSGVFYLRTLDVDQTDRYDVLNGTSMATPQVTGLAALMRARNPAYTYADTRTAIYLGSDRVPSLQTRISLGNTVNADRSIKYVAKPTGVAATIH